MVHFMVTYANNEHGYFDFDYYVNTHLPMGEKLLREYGLTSQEVERGLVNARGEQPAFTCITRLYFSDPDRMRAGFAAHGGELQADIPNYTNIEPVFTLAEALVPKVSS